LFGIKWTPEFEVPHTRTKLVEVSPDDVISGEVKSTNYCGTLSGLIGLQGRFEIIAPKINYLPTGAHEVIILASEAKTYCIALLTFVLQNQNRKHTETCNKVRSYKKNPPTAKCFLENSPTA